MADHPFDFNVKVYHLEGYEVHKVGHPDDGAAVKFNLRYEKETLVKDGLEYTAQKPVRDGEPYVSLIAIAFDSDGTPYRYKSSPMEGGAHEVYARRIGQELIMAADYCEWLKS